MHQIESLHEIDLEISTNQQLQLVKQTRQWADLNTGAILDQNCLFYSHKDIKGFIGYKVESHCAIVFGDPVCDPANKMELAKAFRQYCRKQNLDIIYTMISEDFANKAINNLGSILLQFGNKLIVDSTEDLTKKKGSRAALLRNKLKRAAHEGISIHEYTNTNPIIEEEMKKLGEGWLQSRHGPQVYISHLNLFENRDGKKWYYAKLQEKIVGILVLSESHAHQCWLLNHLITSYDVPHGTSEFLMYSALKLLEHDQYTKVAIGPVTAKNLTNSQGIGTISKWILNCIFKILKKVFRLDGQSIYWDKFHPTAEPSYLLFETVNFRTIKALIRSLNAKL